MGTVTVSAQSPMYSNLVTQIAQRFNLKESDVQDVVNQVRQSKVSSMQANWEARLAKAVTEGKITDAQKSAIIAKHAELQTAYLGLKDLSASERKAKITQIQADLKQWASDNKLDASLLKMLGLRSGVREGFKLGYWAGSK